MKIKKIPQTTKNLYISGWEALNTPYNSGETADWHSFLFWHSNDTDTQIKLYENNSILKDRGIEKRKIIYSDKEVYIANFPRAIADLLLHKKHNKNLIGSVEDFLNEKDSTILYEYLKEIQKIKDISWFVKSEYPKLYYKELEIWKN